MDIALHIGVDSKGKSRAFENDASALQRLTAAAGFRSRAILGAYAKPGSVLASIEDALRRTRARRLLVLSFSTHGLSDCTTCERVYLHEGWIKDKDLHRLFVTHLQPGARVVLIANACQSKGLFSSELLHTSTHAVAARAADIANALVARVHRPDHVSIGALPKAAWIDRLPGRILELAAADRHQLARVNVPQCCVDGVEHGCFVAGILRAMARSPPPASWSGLLDRVRDWVLDATGHAQEPQFSFAGPDDPDFDALPPFKPTGRGNKT